LEMNERGMARDPGLMSEHELYQNTSALQALFGRGKYDIHPSLSIFKAIIGMVVQNYLASTAASLSHLVHKHAHSNHGHIALTLSSLSKSSTS
jgi:hypothetical protein